MKCSLAKRLFGSALVLVAAWVGSGCASSSTSSTNGAAANRVVEEAYRIGPEDVLRITVWKNEAMSGTVPVRPDGKISLPLINDIQAAGLTALELRDVIAQRLQEYEKNPEVSVIVQEVRSYRVSIMGEVARPGRYDLKSAATVLDVLALAGGFTQFASRSRIVVLRPEGSTTKQIPFDYTKVPKDQENFPLKNGDVVLVP